MKNKLIICLTCIYSTICFSTLFAQTIPSWVYESDRKEANGNIIHWGTGIDTSQDIAIFKAEQMAIKSIVDECGGFAHKSIAVIKKYVGETPKVSTYQAYVLASIENVACEYGRNPLAKGNKEVEGKSLVEGQRLYKELLFKPNPSSRKEIVNYQQQIDALKKDVKELKNRPIQNNIYNTNTTVHQTVQVKNVTVVGSPAKYEECMQDYNDLMDQAREAAQESHIPGNLADGKAQPIHNRAQVKLYRCQQMKR